MDFGRLEYGNMQFLFEHVAFSEFVRQVAADFGASQQARGHHVEVRACPQQSMVQADRETLRCVLWNLFENAVEVFARLRHGMGGRGGQR